MTNKQKNTKRIFDFMAALIGLIVTSWIILTSWIVATIDTRSNGFFLQNRVGQHGVIFKVIKIKTMREIKNHTTTVTTVNDARITKSGAFFRRYKIDELPQLFNVLIGQMSFVGPRPDVPGFADLLEGNDRKMLELKPGITGTASLKYKDEEVTLAKQNDPEKYNKEVIFPDKVKINLEYLKNYSFHDDMKIILQTIGLINSNL